MKKNRLLFFIIIIIGLSCNITRKSIRSKDIELIKQLTYCKCLDYNIKNFVGVDSVDISSGLIADLISVYGGDFARKYMSALDSIAYKVYIDAKRVQFDTGKHESSYGKVAYKLDCLELYKSKKVDSLARIIYYDLSNSN